MTSRASRSSLLAVLFAVAPVGAAASSLDFNLPGLHFSGLPQEPAAIPSFEPVPVGFGDTGHGDYRVLAEDLEAAGVDFPAIFRRACAEAARRGGGARETKAMLAGLMTWLGDRRLPRTIGLQGRLDWAFHFVYGAWLESVASGLGERAAVEKESRDARAPGNVYDLDDLTATFLGARWTAREVPRLSDWGDGRRRLETLPPLRMGKLPRGVLADARQLQAVRDFVAAALP